MSTRQKQLPANGANALRSTGPRTPHGKAIVRRYEKRIQNALYRAMKQLDRLKHHRLQRRKPRS